MATQRVHKMATTVKVDSNEPIESNYVGYYFPFRHKKNKTTEGAWLESYKAEQRRHFKAVLCKNFKSLDEIRCRVHRTQKKIQVNLSDQTLDEIEAKRLNGFFLLKHCHADDPSDIFFININDQGFGSASPEDFALFDKVQCISARENRLELNSFVTFSHLQELEMPLNGMYTLKLKYGDFPFLQLLDLSYNNLTGHCLKSLGFMPNLITLVLSGNAISELPTDIAKYFRMGDSVRYLRFPRLRVLKLDNNKLWHPETFVSLANLPRLEFLDLESNLLYHVPQLFNQDGKIVLFEELPHSHLNGECSASDITLSSSTCPGSSSSSGKKTRSGSDSTENKSGDVPAEFMSYDLGEEDEALLGDELPISPKQSSSSSGEKDEQKDLVAASSSIEVEKKYCYQTQPVRFLDKSVMPFNQLVSVNLAKNRFSNEESLLAIAIWPKVQAIFLYGNPLLKNKQIRKMMILNHIFTQKLQITLICQPPCAPSHHHTEIYPRALKTVTENVQKIPKLSVDEILALESSKHCPPPPSLRSTSSERSAKRRSRMTNRSYSGGFYQMQDETMNQTEQQVAGASPQSEDRAAEKSKADEKSTFFMTQAYDEPVAVASRESIQPVKRMTSARRLLLQKYKEYEVLFDDDDFDFGEDNDISPVPVTNDIQANLHALRYALDHQCTVLEHPYSLTNIKVHSPTTKVQKLPALTYEERVANVLEDLKQSTSVREIPLSQVFSDPVVHREDLQEARKLIKEVENCYNKQSQKIDELKEFHTE